LFAIIIIGLFVYSQINTPGSQISTLLDKYSCYLKPDDATIKMSDETNTIRFVINAGETIESISQRLLEARVINNATYFSCYARKEKLTYVPGIFVINTPASPADLLVVLEKTPVSATRITIREGLRADEIAVLLEEKLKEEYPETTFTAEAFLSLVTDKNYINSKGFTALTTLEGLLFPDTYEISLTSTPETMMDLLLSTFEKKVTDPLSTEIGNSNLPLEKIIIVASLLEKEATGNLEEKQMISDIIRRRLSEGWFLNIDATILYEKKDWKYPLTLADTKVDGPFNTYTRKGLPPTAISNPGYNSFLAAVTPKSNSYWYYLHDSNGTIRYAKTLSEHQQNINKYL